MPDNVPVGETVSVLVCVRCELGIPDNEGAPGPGVPPNVNPVIASILAGFVKDFVKPEFGRHRKRKQRNPL